MAGKAVETRRRLLEAATAEFAERGIAGARTDRIAAVAGCNKALIFHYFTSKDALFDAVFNAVVVEPVCNEPIDAENLPEYAGRVYDSYIAIRRLPGSRLVPARTSWVGNFARGHHPERPGEGHSDRGGAGIRAFAVSPGTGRPACRRAAHGDALVVDRPRT